ncbi:MAG TPA: family 16 glycosylhydrolase [Burkholderiaceae bacterium]|nr:family 16 glycosylhydrolase [Burkholderiaceae bacterium]
MPSFGSMIAHALRAALLGLALSATAIGTATAQSCPAATPVFADEFNGTTLDLAKWEVMVGDGCSYGLCGWGNNELQSYQAANATVANGVLSITAKKERIGSKGYTSARLRTLNLGGQWKHGRFEARIKTVTGKGLWPAFWMLPATSVPWPASGEIDIQESTGQRAMFNYGTIHYGPSSSAHQQLSSAAYTQPDTLADDFHIYAVEWTPNRISWFIDNVLYATRTPADMANAADWTFENYAYYLILNLAVGGNLGGTVDAAALPQSMQVDYVRVYASPQPSFTGARIAEPNASATYTLANPAGSGASYSWTSPTGQTSSGNSLTVNWGTTGGPVTVNVTDSCGSYSRTVNVRVAPALAKAVTLDDFELVRTLGYTTVSGSFNPGAANPAPDAVNGSAVVARYVRNATQQYDVITASTGAIPDAGPWLKGTRAFHLDLYTDAPVGTPILVQLENAGVATPSNYPAGRHSKYRATTRVQNAWQRLKFLLEDRIDDATADSAVNQLVLMFNPNSFTGHTYVFDDLALYAPASAAATSARVSAVTTGTAAAGGGRKYATATVTVLDNTNAPVAGATVTGNFSGTLAQSNVSGLTDASGKATLRTSASASGTLSVNFCVSNLAAGSLGFDRAASVSLCP